MFVQIKFSPRLITLITFFSIVFPIGVFASQAQAAETFTVDGNMALNTNNNFGRIDGQPRMSIYTRNDSDPDQQFDRINGNRGGTLLKHRSTGNCLNAHYVSDASSVNIWPCNANDVDQNFVLSDVGNGYVQIKRAGTNKCVDSPTRSNQGNVYLWECVGNANQRWKSSATPPPPNGLNLPFRSGQTWYVCQGYQGFISHQNYFALDLTISNKDFGSTACYANDGNASKSAGQALLAPASGKVSYIGSDLVCLSIDNNHSLFLGHIDRTVSNGANVKKDDVLGFGLYW
ncbi:MAG: RICIN domain-containing protein [Nostoc sp.]|uniref:RICIN domain-containing protein n=1 Tax=Nostoc sp. TaxID=1180 RepID=UPI002FF93C01